MRLARIDLTYSPDDGGWYAEVWDKATGENLHTSEASESPGTPTVEARDWAVQNGYEISRVTTID